MATPAIYEPQFRRPIARTFRRTATAAVHLCTRWNIHPDTVSYSSSGAAALAALCYFNAAASPWLLVVGPAFCYLRLWCNMLDGMVAIESGKASWRGEIVNDLPDRLSDVLIFAGVAHSGLNSPFSGYWCALLAVLTAYVGMLGQAVGVQREFSGLMSKPWRMVTLHAGSWLMFAQLRYCNPAPRLVGWTVLDWTCWVIIAGCVQTIWTRLARIDRALRAKQSPPNGCARKS